MSKEQELQAVSQAPGPSESELALQESISSLQQERDALSLQYQAQVTYTDHVTHALSWSAFAHKTIELSVSPAPFVTVAPSDKRVAHCLAMTAAVWKPRHMMFLHNFGHQMGIKYSMEGFIKYLIINTV